MTDPIIAFLRARLDKDAAVARATDETMGQLQLNWSAQPEDEAFSKVVANGRYIVARELSPVDAAHIARHDPARLLREVEAKRRRLARHVPERRRLTLTDDTGATSLAFYVCTWCTPNRLIEQGQAVVEWPCPDVRDDVAAYADHPDYRAEWRP